MSRSAPTLYRSLLITVLGASLLLVIPTLLLLVTLHLSGVIGGDSWMAASNRGAVPQVFGITALEGEACYNHLTRAEPEQCLDLWVGGGPSGRTERRTSPYHFYPDPSVMPETVTLRTRTADLRAVRKALGGSSGGAGFVAMGDWVAQVVQLRPSGGVLIRDVTDVLLHRLRNSTAAEVELRTVDTDEFIAGTWRDTAGLVVAPAEEGHGPTRRTLTFQSPYAGYPSAMGTGSFAAGATVVPVFSASHVAEGVAGLQRVKSFVSVPTDVMLLYANRSILGFLFVTLALFASLVVLLRRFAERHLAPLAALSKRVQDLRRQQAGEGGQADIPPPSAPSVEVSRLIQAVDGLETQWNHNRELSARLADEQAAVHEATARSLHEKQVLLKEIHHRVKNNLQIISSLLNLQSEQVADDQARLLLTESVYRVRSMALIHEQLYGIESLSSVDLATYAADLIRSAGTALAPGALIRLHCEGEVRVGIDQAVPIGLILNELLTNALKYGRSSTGGPETHEVDIRVSSRGGTFQLVVSDKGAGLPEGFDLARSRSLGLELVRSLTRQLRGMVHATSDGGTTFDLRFPRTAESP